MQKFKPSQHLIEQLCQIFGTDKCFSYIDCDMLEFFQHIRKTENLLLIFEGMNITLYHDVLSLRSFLTNNRNGQKKYNVNNLVPPGFTVSDTNLRELFTLLEFVIEQIIVLDNLLPNQTTGGSEFIDLWEKIKLIRSVRIISDRDKRILHKIKETRNIFAHTINDIKNITYDKIPLEYSFESFRKDVFTVSEKLISHYVAIQKKQLSQDKFEEIIRKSGQVSSANHKKPQTI